MRHATKVKAAVFDASARDRKMMIAKIHVAKKEMALGDDDYRAMLIEATGRQSSANCTLPELRAMLDLMKAKGFKARPSAKGASDHPFAKKARAMWISLYHLGAIANPSEQALEAFAARQLGCVRMHWANQAQAYKLVEALKAIANRHGWIQRTDFVSGIKKTMGADAALRVLKIRLVERILQLLREKGIAPDDWDLAKAAWHLAGMTRDRAVALWDVGDLDLLAAALGKKLREASNG